MKKALILAACAAGIAAANARIDAVRGNKS